ncbi:hypothetical protein ElyMa_005225800 [Elysia marginata]|uniref:Peptidase S1 domain-containing protein n=1 Tax=Elysia marginata TaxID=1093978 RepID=A0AAV4JZ16_9GAST|nr:hypothetical protein ElyMa_005225800 [Elysia marginata]
MSPQEFKDSYMSRVKFDYQREALQSFLDLTVRLTVRCTSQDRPDDDDMAGDRGTDKVRVGTGCIWYVRGPNYNRPCFCRNCNGKKTRKQWRFQIATAKHVVYNTEEAKQTKIDLFYDDDSCRKDGRMKSLWGLSVKMELRYPDRDVCNVLCVTCDEDLGERIKSAWFCRSNNVNRHNSPGLGLQPSCDKDSHLVLIASHPHGQPKKITMGYRRYTYRNPRVEYNTPTCPGSSGAPVFGFYTDGYFWWFAPVHSGSLGTGTTFTKRNHKLNFFKKLFYKHVGQKTAHEQLNFGFEWW